MKLSELADLVNKELNITYYPNQNTRFCCHFRGGEVSENGLLYSYHGNGDSPEEAMRDYASQIAGKKMVFGAYTDDRMEFVIPASLET